MRPIRIRPGWIVGLLAAVLSFPAVGYAASESFAPTDDNGYPDFGCFRCHSRVAVMGQKSDESRGPREFLLSANGGLKRIFPFVPDERDHYAFTFPSRGRHPEMERQVCFDCHKMNEMGVGHGRRLYPPTVTQLFEPGKDCASACHDWLKDDIASEGPAGQAHRGTIRPHELLTEDDNPHGKIYREGFRQPLGDVMQSPGIKIAAVSPGCGGCHSLRGPIHGQTPECLDCHQFAPSTKEGGPVAHKHDELIAQAIGRGKAGVVQTSCQMCHETEKGGPTYVKAACYNCHLSGHNPMALTGPQLWGP